MAILGQLDAGGLLNREVPTIHSRSIGAAIDSGMRAEPIRKACGSFSARHPVAFGRRWGMQEMLYPTSYLKSMGLGARQATVAQGFAGVAGLCLVCLVSRQGCGKGVAGGVTRGGSHAWEVWKLAL